MDIWSRVFKDWLFRLGWDLFCGLTRDNEPVGSEDGRLGWILGLMPRFPRLSLSLPNLVAG